MNVNEFSERIKKLRKEHNLTQEELAEKVNVNRTTVAKWENGSLIPLNDTLVELSKTFNISIDELLTGTKSNEIKPNNTPISNNSPKKALGISTAVFIYFIAVSWIIVSTTYLKINENLATAIFILICGIATFIIIYTSMLYKTKEEIKEDNTPKELKNIKSILSTITLVIYLIVSFLTMAWHLTWIIWVISAIIYKIITLIHDLKEEK